MASFRASEGGVDLARIAPSASETNSVHVASSDKRSADEAARELRLKLPAEPYSAVVVFLSPSYDPQAFAQAMAKYFPDSPVYGCTTAGELSPQGITDSGAVALGFIAADFSIVAHPIAGIDMFAFDQLRDSLAQARATLEEVEAGATGRNRFALLLVDGLCRREEALTSAIGACLDDISLVGGSAGDGMDFGETFVLHDGRAHQNAAVLLLVSTPLPCRLFKCKARRHRGRHRKAHRARTQRRARGARICPHHRHS
jgi:hypothetical protein